MMEQFESHNLQLSSTMNKQLEKIMEKQDNMLKKQEEIKGNIQEIQREIQELLLRQNEKNMPVQASMN